MNEEKVKEIKEKSSQFLLSLLNVVGVGVGEKISLGETTDELSIRVYVNQKMPETFFLKYPSEAIPPEIEGVPTDVVKIDDIVKYDNVDSTSEMRQRFRPSPGGCSISHYARNSRGTLGMWVKDKQSGEPVLVSCWHVIANYGSCCVGDPIIQPGRLDGGKVPEDIIAYLERWVDVRIFSSDLPSCKERMKLALKANAPVPWNYIDGAIAKPSSKDVVTNDILGLGKPSGITELKRDMIISKSGATTGVTSGKTFDTDLDIYVKYSGLGYALFKHQILARNSSSWALFNPSKYVLAGLDISI